MQVGREIQKRKIALGFFIISVFYILGSFVIGLICSITTICSFSDGLGRSPLNLLFVLFTFVPIWIGVWIAMRLIHRTPMVKLFGSSGKLNIQLLLKGFFAILFLGIGVETVLQYVPSVKNYIYYEPNTGLLLSDWIKWLLPIVLLSLIHI